VSDLEPALHSDSNYQADLTRPLSKVAGEVCRFIDALPHCEIASHGTCVLSRAAGPADHDERRGYCGLLLANNSFNDGAVVVADSGRCGVPEAPGFDTKPARKSRLTLCYLPHHRGLEGDSEQDQVRSCTNGILPSGPPCYCSLPRLPCRSQIRRHTEQVPGLPR
jgi:hypothetical protein